MVLGPLAALLAIAYAARPAWQQRLRLSMVGLSVLAVAAIVAAYLTGDHFRDANAFFADNQQIDDHEAWAGLLLWVTLGFGVVAIVTAALHRQTGAAGLALRALLGIGAVAVLVLVFLTGEAGARAVWGTGFEG